MILKTPYARSYKNYTYSLCRGPWADDFTDFEGSTKPNNNHTIKLNTIYMWCIARFGTICDALCDLVLSAQF